MSGDVALVEVWRGAMVESRHRGHAVVCDTGGRIVASWGDPEVLIYPRSSAKMFQAVPLAEAVPDLPVERLALACASHEGAPVHVGEVEGWLADLGLGEGALRCGKQTTRDEGLRHRQIREGLPTTQVHNNCSGKHAGFLQLSQIVGGGAEYLEIGDPVQREVKAVFEDLTGAPSPHFAVDGCSAPNHAARLAGFARGLARFAAAGTGTGSRQGAQARLVAAMIARPDLVAGAGRACTELMEAAGGRAALKTGAEGVFAGILPDLGLGVALKISDGATRAAEAALAAILVGLGVLDPNHPATRRRLDAPVTNWRGFETGRVAVTPDLAGWRL